MNFEAHVADQLAHLISMAGDPGWKAWAWHRAKALAASSPMYADVPRLLTAAMTSQAAPPAARAGALAAVPSSLPAKPAGAAPARRRECGSRG